MEKLEKIKELVSSVEKDAGKFYKFGNKAAGTRVRATMQQLKVLAGEVRKEITEKKNSAK